VLTASRESNHSSFNLSPSGSLPFLSAPFTA